MGRPYIPVIKRVLAKTTFGDGCWECLATPSMTYPQTSIRCKPVYAHIVVYEHFVGPVPEGLTLDHLCRNTRCVRWDHLEPVLLAVNILRGNGLAAQNARKTSCPRGHLLAGTNLIVTSTGARRCRCCRREQETRYRARHAA